MKIVTDFIEVKSKGKGTYMDITSAVEKIVEKSGIREGIITIHEMHTTAALVIQEMDGDVHEDTMNAMEGVVPSTRNYRHTYEGIDNATAHIKNQIMGSNLTIPIINGKMALGTWQHIFLVELFKKRKRRVAIAIIGE